MRYNLSTIEDMSFQCLVGSMPFGQLYGGKRESGASPERSGHCKRGERLQCHCAHEYEKVQPDNDPQVRKPAEIPGA